MCQEDHELPPFVHKGVWNALGEAVRKVRHHDWVESGNKIVYFVMTYHIRNDLGSRDIEISFLCRFDRLMLDSRPRGPTRSITLNKHRI